MAAQREARGGVRHGEDERGGRGDKDCEELEGLSRLSYGDEDDFEGVQERDCGEGSQSIPYVPRGFVFLQRLLVRRNASAKIST